MQAELSMDEKYWDRMAADYDGEIFSVLASDRNEVIVSVIQKFGSRDAAACDFGCGTGKFLLVLAENFRTISLSICQANCSNRHVKIAGICATSHFQRQTFRKTN